MPTLPLYDAAAPPNGYHYVTAPGGYEWWQFRVTTNTANAPQLIALTFYDGRPHDPDYRERYRKYRVWPTHHVPPVPREYRGMELTLGIAGARPRVAFIPCAPEEFVVANDGAELRCGGAGEFRFAPDGSTRASYRNGGTVLEMLLQARGGSRPEFLVMPAAGGVLGQHWEVIGQPVYRATGRLNSTSFEGDGIVEHCWGISPPPRAK